MVLNQSVEGAERRATLILAPLALLAQVRIGRLFIGILWFH